MPSRVAGAENREESETLSKRFGFPPCGDRGVVYVSIAFLSAASMTSSRDSTTMEPPALDDGRAVTELSLVEIASRLEKITSAIEEQRTKERAARKIYKVVADQVDQEVERIRLYARSLLIEQRRRLDSFNGMLSKQPDPLPPASNGGINGRELRELKLPGTSLGLDPRDEHDAETSSGRLSIGDAMLRIWTIEKYKRPLTTEEISQALTEVGYVSKASPRSMKSTLNQVLAKLCRERRIRRFRTDGAEIDVSDTHSRARKYLLA